jgi:hypothetical protein
MQCFAKRQNAPQKQVSPVLARSKTAAPGRDQREYPIRHLASHRFGHDFGSIRIFAKTSTKPRAEQTGNIPKDFHAQASSHASDQKLSVNAFEESLNGVHIEAVASGIDMPDPWVCPDGFRWVQTVATNDPLPGKGPESVDGGGSEPFYYSYKPGEKNPRTFEDYSQRNVPSGSRTIVWNATLALVGVDTSKKSLKPYDIRTYGFRLTRMSGTASVGQVQLVSPKQDWAAFGKHRDVVTAAFPDWELSLLKGR